MRFPIRTIFSTSIGDNVRCIMNGRRLSFDKHSKLGENISYRSKKGAKKEANILAVVSITLDAKRSPIESTSVTMSRGA